MNRTLFITLMLVTTFSSRVLFSQTNQEEKTIEEESPLNKEAQAEEDGDETVDPDLSRDLRGEPLDSLSREDLEERGFVFQDQNVRRDDTTAVILSLTAGIGVHGIGHLYLGDKTTGAVLIGAEVLSILMMSGAGIAYIVTNGSSKSNSVIAPIFDSGLALFVFSYLVDVAGTIGGPDNAFPTNVPLDRAITFSTVYGFTASRGSVVRHALNASVDGDFRFLTFDAGTTQDIFLDTSMYEASAGFRPFKFRRSRSEIQLKAHTEYIIHSSRGPFSRSAVDGRFVGTLDVGDLFAQVRGFALTVEGGYGNRWWSFANENNALEVQSQKRYAPFDFRASAWLTPNLYVSGGYGTPKTPFVASVSRILGVSHVEVRYKTSPIVDLRVRGELGDGFSSWIGAGISPF